VLVRAKDHLPIVDNAVPRRRSYEATHLRGDPDNNGPLNPENITAKMLTEGAAGLKPGRISVAKCEPEFGDFQVGDNYFEGRPASSCTALSSPVAVAMAPRGWVFSLMLLLPGGWSSIGISPNVSELVLIRAPSSFGLGPSQSNTVRYIDIYIYKYTLIVVLTSFQVPSLLVSNGNPLSDLRLTYWSSSPALPLYGFIDGVV
jgi:hypothetical protein